MEERGERGGRRAGDLGCEGAQVGGVAPGGGGEGVVIVLLGGWCVRVGHRMGDGGFG